LHIHVSETEAQVDESEKQYGASPFGRLHTAGAFDLNLIVAHGLWVKESDLKYMRSNTWFAASPKTYMKLAMGEGGLWQYWRQLNLATGTDGAASSNTQSPLEQLRLFGLIGKQRFGADRFTVPELWRILMAGHDALGFHTGRVAAGYQADLVVWDLEQPNTAPVHNPMAAIIYSADARNVRDVVVHGKVLKRNVELTGGTRPEVLRRASEAAREIVVRGKGTAKVTY
jgi:5-methylthioadenosine/S-adenosylhomocysteine deaminase